MPCYTLLDSTTCICTHHYKPFTPWYTQLLTTFSGTHHYYFCTHLICLDAHHVPCYSSIHNLYALVHTTTHFICLNSAHLFCFGTHCTCLCTRHYTLHALVHTTTHLICWYTLYIPWQIQVHALYALVHTTTHVICLGCTMHNSTLHHAQLHPKQRLALRIFFGITQILLDLEF